MNSSHNIKLKNFAAAASILTAVILTAMKAVAAMMTGSLSILSSMIDSLSDVVSSIITYIAVHFSGKPINDKHRYGYGKAEAVSALMQAAFIIGSAGFILYDGISHCIKPVVIKETNFGIAIMFISLLLTAVLVTIQRYVVKKTNSLAIAADSLHYVVDFLSNASVIVSLIIVHYWKLYWIDICTAVAIAIYLLYNTWQMICHALDEITDKELPDNIKSDIINLVRSVPEVRGCHDFRSRIAAAQFFIELHLEFDGNLSLLETHHLSDLAENKIHEKYPQAQVIIHQDPYGIKESRLDYDVEQRCSI